MADDRKEPDPSNPAALDPCFTIHGRPTESNGIPLRLWWIGTRRVFAPDDIPANVAELLEIGWRAGQPMSIQVFADFRVCPLEKDRPGWMRRVRIQSASRLVATMDGKVVKRP